MFSLSAFVLFPWNVLMSPVSSTKTEFTWYDSSQKQWKQKNKKYILMNHCMVIFVDWMSLLLLLKYIRARILRWECAVFLGCKLALLLWNSKAADLYQLSIWPFVYNTASTGTSDALPSAVGTFSFSSTSWIFLSPSQTLNVTANLNVNMVLFLLLIVVGQITFH